MKHFISRAFAILLFLFLIQSQLTNAQYSFDTQKLKSYLSTLEKYDKFMGAVAILENDEVLFQSAYGFINEEKQPANSETVYRIGSITKTFTSTILLRLMEEEKIELSDKLSDFFPDIPNADQITIEHLLHHRSGLVNLTSMPEYQEYYTKEVTREEMLNRIIKYGTSFEPGEKFEYSNTGYILLGYIIEDLTGITYGDALQKYITEPLGLDRTYYDPTTSAAKNEAHSFAYMQGVWERIPETHMSVPHGAGGIVSTSGETAQFFNTLFDGELITNESLEKMTMLKDGYGLGIIRIPFQDKWAWGHNGGIDGFQSTTGHFIDEDITFSLIGNGFNYAMNDIAIGVLSILFNHEFEIPDFSSEPEEVQLSESELNAYTGSYSTEAIPLEINVFLEGGVLKAQGTGQGAFPLTAYENSVMKFEPAGITMSFKNQENGQFQAFEFQQAGQTFTFTLNED